MSDKQLCRATKLHDKVARLYCLFDIDLILCRLDNLLVVTTAIFDDLSDNRRRLDINMNM